MILQVCEAQVVGWPVDRAEPSDESVCAIDAKASEAAVDQLPPPIFPRVKHCTVVDFLKRLTVLMLNVIQAVHRRKYARSENAEHPRGAFFFEHLLKHFAAMS